LGDRIVKGLYIGTSGWHYGHWKGNFYPETLTASAMLSWYSRQFSTVEINNSFYRLPTPAATQNWVEQTPEGFCFAVKGSRFITHNRKLLRPEEPLARMSTITELFGPKLGPILFQLPPSWKVNQQRLAEFLQALPKNRKWVFEFRNPTWYSSSVLQTLRESNVALCISDLAGKLSPIEVTADFVYVRLHGPGKAYQGDYSKASLRTWAKRIEQWRASACAVYFYFDNDQVGFAAKNALELKKLVGA
jgi:uncharacterized protein YecE (DUF72 family)